MVTVYISDGAVSNHVPPSPGAIGPSVEYGAIKVNVPSGVAVTVWTYSNVRP